ncbi:hypothetical protein GCM10010515_71290 [Streptomyces fructofermentans]|uniref:Uncharacterized protein n=1 Tax=Streptomyces fructofermentans TaxID=152141 RepID=A0A918NT84_9ACTN|nr:hypothetical protein GCM10010515_71290 [Streptomyces fructofermentans]
MPSRFAGRRPASAPAAPPDPSRLRARPAHVLAAPPAAEPGRASLAPLLDYAQRPARGAELTVGGGRAPGVWRARTWGNLSCD